MKKLGIATLALLLAGTLGASAASINWGAAGSDWMLDDEGSALALGNAVWLVYAGADGIADWDQWDNTQANLEDDVVAATMTVGTGTTKGSVAGRAVSTYNYVFDDDYTTTDTFYIMFWDSDTSLYGVVGLNDSGTTGSATTWSIAATDNAGQDDMFPSSSSTADITPVPEPGTILLGLAGAGALLARRRKSKKA